MTYAFLNQNRLPHEVYDLPQGEKALIYAALTLRIEAEEKANKK